MLSFKALAQTETPSTADPKRKRGGHNLELAISDVMAMLSLSSPSFDNAGCPRAYACTPELTLGFATVMRMSASLFP